MPDYWLSKKHGQFTATPKHEREHDLNCPCMKKVASAWCNQHDRYEEVDSHKRSADDENRKYRDKAQLSFWLNRDKKRKLSHG